MRSTSVRNTNGIYRIASPKLATAQEPAHCRGLTNTNRAKRQSAIVRLANSERHRAPGYVARELPRTRNSYQNRTMSGSALVDGRVERAQLNPAKADFNPRADNRGF